MSSFIRRSSVDCEPVQIAVFMFILAAEVVQHLRNEQDLNDLLDDNGTEPAGSPDIPEKTLVVVPGPHPADE